MKDLGFKCGIEIHQQLEGKKLFCNCPTEIRKDKADFKFKRYLKASAGESGKFDKAAKYEQKKEKYFIYHAYEDSTCLVEMDESPPREVNQNSLNTSLQIAKMLNCKIPEEILFMRKVVVDGSNVSGFQRTGLVGMDGFVEVNGKKIRISSVCLEEEACQVIERKKDHDEYNLSRLGIPLIEIATEPDIESPEECQEVAAKLGMILRSFENCKRGIGSIRQDVNVSIKEGYRVEIKGFQDLRSIPKIVNFEVDRQLKEKKKQGPHVRKAEPDFTTSFLRPMPGSARMYPETDIPAVTPNIKNIEIVETLEEKQAKYEKDFKLNSDFSSLVVKYEEKKDISFREIFKKYKNIEPKTLVNTIINLAKEIKTRFNLEVNILDHQFVLEALNENKITSSSLEDIYVKLGKGKKVNLDNYKAASKEDIKKDIKKIVNDNQGAPFGKLMGLAMAHFKGKVDGKVVSEILKKVM